MSWRTVVITNRCKLSYKNNYLIMRNEENNMIHLSEVGIIIIDSTLVSITSYLMVELVKRKIKLIFCDEKRNPISELLPLYGSHNTSKRLSQQIQWDDTNKAIIWSKIIKNKIKNQAFVLKKFHKKEAEILLEYANQVEYNDISNREGHAARVYFSSLFGKDFIRHSGDDINAALNYGYAILVSSINKEIVSNGCVTQLGIKHKNEFNYFNLSYDLVEPFRVFVDDLVVQNMDDHFENEFKYELVNVLNSKVKIKGKSYFLTNAIKIYVKNILNALDDKNPTLVQEIYI